MPRVADPLAGFAGGRKTKSLRQLESAASLGYGERQLSLGACGRDSQMGNCCQSLPAQGRHPLGTRQETDSHFASRRQFLRQSVAVAGAFGAPVVVPASALGTGDAVAPSNRVVMGCIGLGIQGMGNMRTFRGNTETEIAAYRENGPQ